MGGREERAFSRKPSPPFPHISHLSRIDQNAVGNAARNGGAVCVDGQTFGFGLVGAVAHFDQHAGHPGTAQDMEGGGLDAAVVGPVILFPEILERRLVDVPRKAAGFLFLDSEKAMGRQLFPRGAAAVAEGVFDGGEAG